MSENKRAFCQWSRCDKESEVIWYDLGFCDRCWTNKLCEMDLAAAKKKFGIEEVAVEKTEENGKSENRENRIMEKVVEVAEKIEENK